MVNKELINYIKSNIFISDEEYLEKDILLHLLLIYLTKDGFFKNNFAFKGGTCLIKCYLGYYRFSEDLDFTFTNQSFFKNKSEKSIRKDLSKIITDLSNLLKSISQKLNLDFSLNKSNKKFYEFGANNKFVTFKLWYVSKITTKEQFIKIQINFVEQMFFSTKQKIANSLFCDLNKNNFLFLFPEYKDLLHSPRIKTYDIKEIFLEKNRAILTRKGIKTRDFVDLFLIFKKLNQKLIYEQKIIEKTTFMFDKYKKYKENLLLRKKIGFDFSFNEERKLLLKPINQKEFKKFIESYKLFLNKIIQKILD